MFKINLWLASYSPGDSSEQIPLNSCDSREKVLLKASPRRFNSSENKHENGIEAFIEYNDHPVENTQHQSRIFYRSSEDDRTKENSRKERDIAAMSVASIYNDENNDMDSDKWVTNSERKTKSK